MDFGIGFLSNNVMLPILDFFYGLVPSYGLAIVALTVVIRLGLYPLSAGSIRNARRMRIANPVLQKRQQEVRERYKDDPAKQQEELGKLFQEFGNPLSGCLPLLFQMPILFALFATLRGSPFSTTNYTLSVDVLPQTKLEQVQPQAVTSKTQNLYVADGVHFPVTASIMGGNALGVGDQAKLKFETTSGQPLKEAVQEYGTFKLRPQLAVTKGDDHVAIREDGTIEALEPGSATIQASIPGLASDRGFLFIKALGRVGAVDENGAINWDIVLMVLTFGISLYVNQKMSGQGSTGNPQQDTVNSITPVIFSGMFLFFPLPAGVLMYMVIANIFQTAQTIILSREPLPENLQKIVEAEKRKEAIASGEGRLPFEPVSTKKQKKEGETEESANGSAAGTATVSKAAPKPNSPKSSSKKKKKTSP
ncbi:MAG: membrane protein insertase YidC [Prochlorothrix sp.]|nr:membrane protein insertase YidC [Prochlorothrix sp.]